MSGERQFVFPPFTLDRATDSLLRGSKKIPLRPKSFSLLHYLLEHPTRLVTKAELMEAAWPATKVVDSALKVSIWEIRHALEDPAEAPKFIEAIGRKGYRFIAPVGVQFSEGAAGGDKPSQRTYLVGRSSDLQQLEGWLGSARRGNRQIIFVTGEPGIGKTTLVEGFTKSLPRNDGIITAHGQCIEQYGAGEAYMPILDALEQMCGGSNGEPTVDRLRQYAPSWLVNLPGFIGAAESAELERQIVGVTPERRLREIAAFLERMAREQTIILILEDLHWLDPSSLALLSFLARRREAARLMLIGTYREGEVESFNHPLRQIKEELELHHYCSHLLLRFLTKGAVGEYLAARFETPLISNKVLSTVYQRSEGNPLFMVGVTDYLVTRQAITQQNGLVELDQQIEKETTPITIQQLIERQFETLPPDDQESLELASVAGMSFSAAVLAAVLGKPLEDVEKQCNRLVKRQHFLQPSGMTKWPDGTVSSGYSFIHALYENVIYDRIGDSRKARLHQTIGERLEAGYQKATGDIAAELATHFQRGGDYARAVHYLFQNAQKAMRQCGYQEAISDATIGLRLLKSLPKTSKRSELELSLELLLGVSLASAKGYAAAEAQQPFSNARALSHKVGNKFILFQALAGLWSFYLIRGDLRSSYELAQQMLKLARQARQMDFSLNSQMAAGLSLFYLGDILAAHNHLDKSASYYDLERYRLKAPVYGWDPGLVVACYKAKTFWLLGYPNKAESEAKKALNIARELSGPFHSALANGLLAVYYTYRGEIDQTLHTAEAAIKVSTEGGFNHWLALGTLLKGWAVAKRGQSKDGIQCLREGIAKWRATGAEMVMPTFLVLQAEAHLAAEEFQNSLKSIQEGFAISKKNHETYYDAELYRLKGELLLKMTNSKSKRDDFEEAEKSLVRAIKISRDQHTKSLELRSVMSLCDFWKRTGKVKEARKMLAKTYDCFTEGFNTPDLEKAKSLLNELS